MLLTLRLLSLIVGGFTAWRVLDGHMVSTLFKVPDLAVGAAMVLAALIPSRGATAALVAANAYAFGVFSVALASYLVPSRPVEPLLIAGMAVNLVVILLLFPKMAGGGH